MCFESVNDAGVQRLHDGSRVCGQEEESDVRQLNHLQPFLFDRFYRQDLRVTSPNAYFRWGIPRLGRGASPCFSEKVPCAGKGLKPPFKTVIPPQKPVRPKFDTGTYGYFVCLYRGVPVPVSNTNWRGKVGTPEKCACIVIVPVSSVPVSNIYCSGINRVWALWLCVCALLPGA